MNKELWKEKTKGLFNINQWTLFWCIYDEKDKEIERLTVESTEFESKYYDLQKEIIKLKSQNKLLSAENSYYKHIINELEKWIRWKMLHCVDYECFPEETLDKLKELKENNK